MNSNEWQVSYRYELVVITPKNKSKRGNRKQERQKSQHIDIPVDVIEKQLANSIQSNTVFVLSLYEETYDHHWPLGKGYESQLADG
jgi:hypothetical protein